MKIKSGLAVIVCLSFIFDLVISQAQFLTPKRIDPIRQQTLQSWPYYTKIQNTSFMLTTTQSTRQNLVETTQRDISNNRPQLKGLVKECIERNGLKSCLMEVFRDSNEVNQIDFKYILEALSVVSERSLQYCYDVFSKKVCDMANDLNGHHIMSPSQNQPWPRPNITIINTTRAPALNESFRTPFLQAVNTNNSPKQQQPYQNQIHTANQTIRYLDGSLYIGQLENGRRHGKGMYMFPNGEKYDGDWLNNEMSGNGTYHFSNGDVYQGNWVQGKRTGYGVYISKNGDKYIGGWVNGVREGNGTHFFVNGDRLQGQFKNGQSNGIGTYFWKNGDSYTGQWVNSNKYGVGNYTYANGKMLKGRWDNANLFIKV